MHTFRLPGAMRKDLAQIVCCPVHRTPLELKAKRRDEAGDVLEGSLRCAKCDFDYPIEEGIPNLLPPSYHVDEVKEARPAGKARAAGKNPGGAKDASQDPVAAKSAGKKQPGAVKKDPGAKAGSQGAKDKGGK
jgi:uncharacterized protein